MRIATFNILSGRSPSDDAVDEERFCRAIASLDADVLGLQEVDRNQPRSRHADLTALAAESMGAVDHRFVAALSGTPGATWSAATGDEQPDSAAYGIALLSRYPVLGWQVVRLPPAPVRIPHRFHGRLVPEWVGDEPRTAVLAEIDSPLGRLRVATTHLSFLSVWNGHQLRLLRRSLGHGHGQGQGEGQGPTLLTGDLNMTPRRALRVSGMRPLAGGVTFPAQRPAVQLDHILSDRPLSTSYAGPVALPVSDHRALVADVARL